MSSDAVNLSRACFVPCCRTGYASDKRNKRVAGQAYPSLFKAPKVPELLLKWRQAIPRKDLEIESTNVVCGLHFPEEDILYFYETKLRDGTISRIKRGKPKLRDGSVPCIFPNLPSYLSMANSERAEISVGDATGNESIGQIVEENTNFCDDLKHDNILNRFDCLKSSLATISTPNGFWSGSFIPARNEIIFVEWDETYTPEKKIIIHQDMSYKVFLGKIEIKLYGKCTELHNVGDLEEVIKMVDKLRVCV